jgi:hypothetical protein
VLPAVHPFLADRAKTKQGKDAGSLDTDTIRVTEDAAMRRSAAGRVDNVCAAGST